MKKLSVMRSITKEEVLHYMIDEWNDSLRQNGDGIWTTTFALRNKLELRGVRLSWQTLSKRLSKLLCDGSVEMIETTGGSCWKPIMDTFKI